MRNVSLVPQLVLTTAAVLLAAACSHPEPPAPQPRPVLVEHPQSLADESGEVFPGSVRARVEADLAFRVPGKIIARKVDAGSLIKPGEVLASLDPRDAHLNTASAEASVAAAEADVRLAESELVRHKEMLEKGFISRSLYDVRENNLKLAKAKEDQARSTLAMVRNQAGYTNLIADKAGIITAVLAEAGQVVAAGQPVLRYAAEAEREVLISVPEGRVLALRKAPKLTVTLWAQPGKFYQGRVREITPQADRNTRTHEARVSIVDADAAVQLGMTASVIMGEEIQASLFRVPLSALGTANGKPAVWVITAGHAHALPVTVLRYVEGFAIVNGDLKPEMQMVSAGVHLLVENQEVTTLERKREAQES